ncbi:hypothetical protein RchiOBHm_Chr6g0280381 [Rosa chinensis]|uniref:Uncharacterized protein n=1 Tax=Rosa chinensis TaxID=74649 RepID=A0A2P6PT85_ROSCH|nr:hypothetical protein RchiOBHm_Chr6g0280381 [Rosa chinensis]
MAGSSSSSGAPPPVLSQVLISSLLAPARPSLLGFNIDELPLPFMENGVVSSALFLGGDDIKGNCFSPKKQYNLLKHSSIMPLIITPGLLYLVFPCRRRADSNIDRCYSVILSM